MLSLLCGVLHISAEIMLVLALGYALEADLNQGVMCSVYAVSIVVVLLGSMAFLREKIRFCQIIGIAFIVAAIICIGFAGNEASAPSPSPDPPAPQP